jgi:hypothetical protein
MTIFTRTSVMTGKVHEMDIPNITESDVQKWKASRVKIQDYFPKLTPAQREFLITGTTQEEWDTLAEHE